MSAEALGWAFKRSPFKGDQFVIHLSIADATDDMDDNTFALSVPALATKSRCSPRLVQYTLRAMEEAGLVTKIDPGGGRGHPAIYRFEFPTERAQDVRPSETVQTPEHESTSLSTEGTTQELAVAPFPVAPIRRPRPRRAPAPGGDGEAPSLTKAERDSIWDAVAEACGGEWSGRLVGHSRGRMATGVSQIIDMGCRTPDEVRRRARVYRTKYRGMDLTPTALASNWPSLGSVSDVPADYNPATAWMYQ